MAAPSDHGGRAVPGLEREGVVRAALALLDEVGFARLTLRRLAERLHVKAAALYWHFTNKQDLIDAMAAHIMHEELRKARPGGSDWRQLLTSVAHTNRNALMRYRDGAQIMAHADMRRTFSMAGRERLLARLQAEGFSPELALASIFSIVRYTLGCVFEEQADPATAEAPRGSEMFEQGLALLLDGIASALQRLNHS